MSVTEPSVLTNWCEFFLTTGGRDIYCEPDELDLMQEYSEYLILHNDTCLSMFNCGYNGYMVTNKIYNLCQKYWLNIALWKWKCQMPLPAYQQYTRQNTVCYRCDEHEIDYTNPFFPQGLCPSNIISQETKTPVQTTKTVTSNPTMNPSKSLHQLRLIILQQIQR